MASLRETFDLVIDSYSEWVSAVRSPSFAARRALLGRDDKERVKRATTIWFAAVFLSLVLTLPIYSIYGLTIENLGFQLCAVVGQYVALFAFAFVFHVSLRAYHIQSRFLDTFAVYTILTAAISPLVVLMNLPSLLRSLHLLQEVKKQHLPVLKTIEEAANRMLTADANLSSMIMLALQPLVAIISFVLLASFVVLLAERYKTDTWRVARAVALAATVPCLLVSSVVFVLQHVLFYIFMSAS